ncbi:MAG: CHAT domain-containing protein, partial [Pseudomonadota bacterium]
PIATFTLWRQLASALLMRGSTVVNNADSLEAITIFRVLADQGGELKHSSLEHAMLLIGQAEVLYQNSLNSRSVTILAKALELFEEVFENLDNLFVIRRIEILIRIGQFRLEYAYILMETPDLVFNSYTIGYISVLNSAETALREALQGAERIGSRVLVDIAKWSLARFYYLRAASTWDLKVALDGCLLLGDAVLAVGSAPPAGRVRGWLDIARLHKLVWQISANKSMLPRARRQAEIAVEWCAHLGDRALCSEAITELGMLLVLLGDYDAALEKLGSEADSARRIAILARTAVDRRRALGILAKASSGSALALLRLGEVERALTKAIAARAVQLSLAALLDAKEDTDQGKSRSIRSAYLHAQSNLDAAEQRYLLLSRQTEDLDRRIVEEEIASARSALEESMKGLEFLVEEAGSEGQIPSLDSIAGSLPPNGAMVVLIVTEAGCGAIMIPANCTALDSRNVLYLDNITDQWVERVISGSPWERKSSWLAHYARFHDPNARYLPHWNRALEELLPMLWDKLMGPISKRLNELGLKKGAEIVLMAPAELAALPLSAAGHRNEAGRWNCFLDQWTLSIASSAQHYVNAAQKLRANQQNRACLLCVTDPLGDIGVASNPASSFFPTEVTSELRGPVATVDSVLLQMTEATHLSFFCHGTFNRSHPEQSGLLLASEGIPPAPSILTFTDIRSLDLRRGRLAILGACETAKVSLEDYRTEYVGLPTAMMEAGVSSVIASNWLADTQSTYWLVSELVARERTGVTPAAALRAAQLALRDGEKPSEGQAEMVPLSFRQSGRMNREFADQPAIWATFSAWGA